MFVPPSCADDVDEIDPRDVVGSARSAFCESRLPEFAAVLDAHPDALDEVGQLDLAGALTACVATLDWRRCQVASAFALRQRDSPYVASSARRRGGITLRRMGGLGTPEVPDSAVTELALELGVSEYAATDLVAVGLDLRYRLPCTANDLGGGRLTYGHAKVISEATRELAPEAVESLDARLADAACTRTPARLRVLARRLVGRVDAEALHRRHRGAYDERSASGFPVGDGMGAFSLSHQLETISVIDDHITAWARRRRLLDPCTGLDAHRADAAAHLLLGQHPLTGAPLIGPSRQDNQTSNPSARADCKTGHRDIGPGGHRPPWPAPGSDIESAIRPEASCAHGPDITGWPDLAVVADPSCFLPARAELRVVMSADTLLGIDDESCEIQGYGPITAEQARRLALQTAPTTLRRIFTDPADGSVMLLDARTYRFRRDQEEVVRALHPISAFPGGTTPAQRCDIDHRRPYRRAPAGGADPPGQTVVVNGQPLGRRHHRMRTHAGWTPHVDPDDPHTTQWTSPHGRTYVVQDHDGA